MTFRLKDSIHKTLADSVFNELFSGRSNYYFFIGKVVPWSDPNSPPTPPVTFFYENDTRNRIINVEKVITADVSLVIPRRNWATGTVYDQFQDYSANVTAYSGATSLKASNFYVLNSSFQVYKCISNNDNAQSTVEPSGNELGTFSTADGYVWKFMYTIPLALRSRFLTSAFMPVQKSVLNSFYNDGQVSAVVVDSRGSGYNNTPVVNLTANATFDPGLPGNITPHLIPVISESGSFESVVIANAGNNVISANIMIVDANATGSNLYANTKTGDNQVITSTTANLIPVVADGKVRDVIIVDPGKDYSSNNRTIITSSGDGSGATFLPYVNESGELEDVIITNRGSGYTNISFNVIGETGSGANLSATFSTGDLDTTQSQVELSAVAGAIHNFRIINSGNNYSNVSNVEISVTGDGSGFVGTVNLDTATNTISNISISDPGSGFTFANVQITGGGGTDANVQAILSPPNGHGFDAPTELFADSLMFFSTINNEQIQGIPVNNDFRQFGIIKDLEQNGSRKAFSNTTGSPCFLATFDTLTNSGNTIADDTILELKNSDPKREFVVVATKTANTQMLLTNLNNHTLTASDVLTDSATATDFTVQSIDKSPDINKFSGDLLFIDNRTAVSFTEEQLVTFRTILRL